MKRVITLMLFLFFGLVLAQAQINTTEKCAFDRLQLELLKQPVVQKALQKNERHIARYRNTAQSRDINMTVTIPVGGPRFSLRRSPGHRSKYSYCPNYQCNYQSQ